MGHQSMSERIQRADWNKSGINRMALMCYE